MAKMLLKIHNLGTYTKITDTEIRPESETFESGYFLTVDQEFKEYVDTLLKTSSIKYLSELGENVTRDDLIIESVEPIILDKGRARTIAKQQFSRRLDTTAIFDIKEFIIINNILISKGYVITDENREEEYLKIINTGDDSLILNLEKFLKAWDNFNDYQVQYEAYLKFEEDLQAANMATEIETVLSQYLESFN